MTICLALPLIFVFICLNINSSQVAFRKIWTAVSLEITLSFSYISIRWNHYWTLQLFKLRVISLNKGMSAHYRSKDFSRQWLKGSVGANTQSFHVRQVGWFKLKEMTSHICNPLRRTVRCAWWKAGHVCWLSTWTRRSEDMVSTAHPCTTCKFSHRLIGAPLISIASGQAVW